MAKRVKTFSFYVEVKEFKRIARRAFVLGMSCSKYIRDACTVEQQRNLLRSGPNTGNGDEQIRET